MEPSKTTSTYRSVLAKMTPLLVAYRQADSSRRTAIREQLERVFQELPANTPTETRQAILDLLGEADRGAA